MHLTFPTRMSIDLRPKPYRAAVGAGQNQRTDGPTEVIVWIDPTTPSQAGLVRR